ncbi:MAG: YccF domain-containing protein [Clostridia bacterium]|nr:YccF domain-containing protein [Clostridia bacterium]
MSCLGNVLWFCLCGIWLGLSWIAVGVLWCCTIVGIPVGLQCFKLAKLSFFPFGREIRQKSSDASCLLNVLWIFFGGIELAIACTVNGLALCVTVIGIPFGLQCFKLARLALTPFGAEVV